jgi:predicted transcriptional regulator
LDFDSNPKFKSGFENHHHTTFYVVQWLSLHVGRRANRDVSTAVIGNHLLHSALALKSLKKDRFEIYRRSS